MGFQPVKRSGSFWDDAKKIDAMIERFPFHTSGKSEREFEQMFATSLMTNDGFNARAITQSDRSVSVKSVYCFGKNHRPDMTLGEDGIAVEVKLIDYEGLKSAIGQGHVYRLQYRFVFIILIVTQKSKQIYYDIESGKEKQLEDLLQHLADKMNIFTYITPAFVIIEATTHVGYAAFTPTPGFLRAPSLSIIHCQLSAQ